MATAKLNINQTEDEFKPIITQQPTHLVGQLRSYQLLALDYLLRVHQKSLLYKNYFKKLGVQEPELDQYQINAIEADQMGLGKTIVTQSLLASIYENYGIRGLHLIIVPKSTVPQWQSEYAKFYPYARVCSVVGYKEERELALNQLLEKPNDFDIVLTTYDIVKIEAEKFQTLQFQYVVLDEGQKLKSQDTLITGTVQSLKTKHKLILTGTPLQNDISELYSLLNVLSPTIFNNVEEFTKLVTTQNTELLQQIINIFMIRRTKQEVETLPEKHEFLIKVPMTTLQRKLYIGLLTRNVDALQSAVQSKSSTIHKTSLLNTLMQLRKVADHPYLLSGVEPTPYQDGPHLRNVSGKMVVLMALIDKILQRNEKVLVFCQMTNMLNIIADWLNYCRYPYLRIDGATDLSQRAAMLKNFNQKQSTCSIFLLSTRAGALGLNLTSANHVIIFQQDFNPQVDSQAVARAHRIGQTKQCYIYRLLTANTVDEKIYERACVKMQLDELVMQQSHFSEDKVIETDLVKQAGKEGLIDMIQYQSNELFEQEQHDIPTPDYNKTEEIKFTDDQIEKLLNEAKEAQDKAYKEAEERKLKKEEIIKKLQQDGKLQGFDTKELYKFDGEVYSKQNLKKLTDKIKAKELAEALIRMQKNKGEKQAQKPEKPRADYPTVAKFKRNQVVYRADYYLLDNQFYSLQNKIIAEVAKIENWFKQHKETVKYQDYQDYLKSSQPEIFNMFYSDLQLPGLTKKELITYRSYLEQNCPYYNSKNFSHEVFNHIMDSLLSYRADKLINQLKIRKAVLYSHHFQRGVIKNPVLGTTYKLFCLTEDYKTAEQIDASGNPMPELAWFEYVKKYKNESTQQNYLSYANALLKKLRKLDNYDKYEEKFRFVKEDRKLYFKNIKALRTYVEMYQNPLFEMPVDKVNRQSGSGHVFSIVEDRYLLWLTDMFGFNNFNDIMTYIKNCKTFMFDWEFKALKQEEVDQRIAELMEEVYRVVKTDDDNTQQYQNEVYEEASSNYESENYEESYEPQQQSYDEDDGYPSSSDSYNDSYISEEESELSYESSDKKTNNKRQNNKNNKQSKKSSKK